MAFPVVASNSTNNGGGISSGADISVTLPSGVTSGDLLIVVVAVDGGSSTSVAFGTLSNGWAKTTDEATTGVAGGVFWKYADGTDALDIPFTASSAEIFSYVAYRITGAHGTTAPEIAKLGSSSVSANPDPPNLSLSGWSTEDTLWIAASTHDHGQWSVSTWPTNYSSNQITARNNLTTGATTAVATRELAASSENPAAFTISASDTWIAWTIAVRPAAGGGATDLTTNEAAHGHSADALTLTTSSVLAIADAAHGHTAESPALSSSLGLAVADATHGHAADALTLTSATGLTVADALHGHAADNPTLDTTGAATLTTQDATHAHSVDAPMLYTDWLLAVAEATHGHSADSLTLDGAPALSVSDATHAHVADSLSLSAGSWLTVQQSTHAHRADAIVLGGSGVPVSTSRYIVRPSVFSRIVNPSAGTRNVRPS